jgi:hypothetical protein
MNTKTLQRTCLARARANCLLLARLAQSPTDPLIRGLAEQAWGEDVDLALGLWQLCGEVLIERLAESYAGLCNRKNPITSLIGREVH